MTKRNQTPENNLLTEFAVKIFIHLIVTIHDYDGGGDGGDGLYTISQ